MDLNDPQPSTFDDSAAEIVLRRTDLLQRAQQFSRTMDRRVREMLGRPAAAALTTADR